MRRARHGNTQMPFRLMGDRPAKRRDHSLNVASGFLHKHPKFGRDHLVAAASGVELGAEGAELLDESGFGEVVDVFGLRGIEPGGVLERAALDFIKRHDKLEALFVRKNSNRGDGTGPCSIERELLGQEAAVELPGTLELIEGSVGAALESAAPHLLAFGAAHRTPASAGTVMGRAKRLMKPSASLGL